MGTDIHAYLEKKNKKGKWEFVKRFPIDRKYNLFSVLANVRNGYGFAGVKTSDGFNPISKPKGLPEDVSKITKKESDSLGVDGHSHSWLTLKEIEEFDWSQKAIIYGLVTLDKYINFLKNNEKFSVYYGWSSGPGVCIIEYTNETREFILDEIKNGKTNDEIEKKIIEKIKKLEIRSGGETTFKNDNYFYVQPPKDLENLYIKASWEETYEEATNIEIIINSLKEEKEESDNIRIVFFFDN